MRAKRILWIVDDDPMWLEILSAHINRGEGGFITRRFTNVDDALIALDTVPPEELPALVSTDGDTRSKHSGIDIAKRLKGTGIGCMVVSANQSKLDQLSEFDCVSAKFIKKDEFLGQDYPSIMEQAIEAAKVEKRLGADNMPGQGTGKGR